MGEKQGGISGGSRGEARGARSPPPQVLVDCASIILSIIQQNEHYFKLLFQFSAASIIRAFMR